MDGSHLKGKSVDERYRIVSKLSAKEEAELVVHHAVDYLHDSLLKSSIPWYAVCENTRGDSHLSAIESSLRMFPDGNFMPISWYDYVIMGYKSPMHRIELKIEQARANAEELEDMLSEFSKGELDVKDQLLIQ